MAVKLKSPSKSAAQSGRNTCHTRDMQDIKGYEGKYAITEDGRVWSHPKSWIGSRGAHHSSGGIFLTPLSANNGYSVVNLSDASKRRKTITIHRLIAIQFIPNPLNLPCVNHKDGNKKNNHVNNLEWCSYSDNIRHAFKTGLRIPNTLKHSEKCSCFRCRPENISPRPTGYKVR